MWADFQKRYTSPENAVAGIANDFKWNLIPSMDFLRNFYSPYVTLALLERQCDETALLAAYAVVDDGYPPLILFLYSENQNYLGANHALFVFQRGGLWGYTDWTNYTAPRFKDIEELFYTYQKAETAYMSYMLFDFSKYDGDWTRTTEPLSITDEITIARGPTSIWLFRTPLVNENGAITKAVRLVRENSGSVNDQDVISSAMQVGRVLNCCGQPPSESEALMTFDLSEIPAGQQC